MALGSSGGAAADEAVEAVEVAAVEAAATEAAALEAAADEAAAVAAEAAEALATAPSTRLRLPFGTGPLGRRSADEFVLLV